MSQSIIVGRSGKDIALEVDSGQGMLRDRLNPPRDSSAFVYQKRSHRPAYTRKGKTSGRIIPYPYPHEIFKWGRNRPIANLPSVIASTIVTGPTRSLSPLRKQRARRTSQLSVEGGNSSYRSRFDFQENGENGNGTNGEATIACGEKEWTPSIEPFTLGTSKSRQDAIRNMPFSSQNLLGKFPRIAKARNTIRSKIGTARRRR